MRIPKQLYKIAVCSILVLCVTLGRVIAYKLLDDFEDRNSQNMFGGHWFTIDDRDESIRATLPPAKRDAYSIVIPVPELNDIPVELHGAHGSDCCMKIYGDLRNSGLRGLDQADPCVALGGEFGDSDQGVMFTDISDYHAIGFYLKVTGSINQIIVKFGDIYSRYSTNYMNDPAHTADDVEPWAYTIPIKAEDYERWQWVVIPLDRFTVPGYFANDVLAHLGDKILAGVGENDWKYVNEVAFEVQGGVGNYGPLEVYIDDVNFLTLDEYADGWFPDKRDSFEIRDVFVSPVVLSQGDGQDMYIEPQVVGPLPVDEIKFNVKLRSVSGGVISSLGETTTTSGVIVWEAAKRDKLNLKPGMYVIEVIAEEDTPLFGFTSKKLTVFVIK